MPLLPELTPPGGFRAGDLGRVFLLLLVPLALSGCGGGGDDAPPLDDAPAAAAALPMNRLTSLEYVDSLGVDFEAMQRTSSGIYYRDVVVGTGEEAATGRTVAVHYTGYLPDGFSFDSNKDSPNPYLVPLGERRVIQGWEQGIPGMRVGGRRTLVIPPELAYGSNGVPAAGIPPNAVLVFDVELLAVD